MIKKDNKNKKLLVQEGTSKKHIDSYNKRHNTEGYKIVKVDNNFNPIVKAKNGKATDSAPIK